MTLDPTSLGRLKDVHPDLVRVVRRAATLSKVPFSVVEGRRTLARQKELLKAGATRILRSRHITGHAVDLVPLLDGKPRWDWTLYYRLAPFVRAAARVEHVPIEWGGDWKSFPDAPHWQLPRKTPYLA